MRVLFYPDGNDLITSSFKDKVELDATGSIPKFFDKLRRKRPDLYSMVKSTLLKVKDKPDLDFLKNNEWVGKLQHSKESIYEFRIPPNARGGVVRLYFGYKKNDSNTIYILSAELKKITGSDKLQLKLAEKRYREVCV